MIATHNPKFFNARLKCSAIAANIEGQVPDYLVCSQTTDMLRKMWACPSNAADIKHWREVVAKLPDDFVPEPCLPGVLDTQLKQLLIPIEWQSDSYVSVSPVASLGVLHELYRRLYEQKLPFRKWVIQPTHAAMANHGESMLIQAGAVRMLRRGPAQIVQGKWRGNFVQFTARCEGMNISSGMLAAGFPAITAIGGFIHSLERQIGQDIEFVFGIKSADWVAGVPKITVHKTSSGTSTGRVKGINVSVVPGYSTEEMVANCEIVLLLRTKVASEDKVASRELQNILKNTYRLVGGRLSDVSVSVITNGIPPAVSYLLDASGDIVRARRNDESDSLQAALSMYGMDGEWVDDERSPGGPRIWHQPRNGYTLNQTGYAFLERPVEKPGVRGNYPHAWAEPTFSLITQGSMTDDCWWTRTRSEAGVFWKGCSVI